MSIRNTLEIAVNIALVLGLVILILGVGSWVLTLSQRFHLSTEAILIIFGCMILIFSILAARLFSRVGHYA